MKFSTWIQDLEVTPDGRGLDAEVADVTCDSRETRPGWAFAALKGDLNDGADFVPAALAAGAVAILIDSGASDASLKIRMRLQQMGFQIEAGVRCRQGLVLWCLVVYLGVDALNRRCREGMQVDILVRHHVPQACPQPGCSLPCMRNHRDRHVRTPAHTTTHRRYC